MRIKEMVRFVRNAVNELGVRLASWEGGNMRNAIHSRLKLFWHCHRAKLQL